MALSH